jgi:zinc protease
LRVERYVLEANGLSLLVLPDHRAPVVSYQTWLAVGSRHEREGKTGIAHLFEHLMFGETASMPFGSFDQRLEEAGAESNAATFLDWTFYLVNLPAAALDLVIELEADRLQNLVLQDPQVDSEREVVLNERRLTVDNDVDGAVAELLYSHAFQTHGYRWPTIGFEKDIESLSTRDCLSFYGTYYAPNNACLVVVGDVDVDRLLEGVEARYGTMAAAPIPVEEVSPEPPQLEERRLSVDKPTPTAKLAVGYHAPALGDFDHPALAILSEILFGGRASRVHRRLVDELELATEVGGSVGGFRDPSLFDIYLTAREGVGASDLLAALDELLDEVVREPPDDAALGRARARLELSSLQGLETAGGKAEQIGFSQVVLGDPAASFRRLEAYGRVTRSDLLRVARRYLRRQARTVVEVAPSESGGA